MPVCLPPGARRKCKRRREKRHSSISSTSTERAESDPDRKQFGPRRQTSIYVGVSQCHHSGRWEAHLWVPGKDIEDEKGGKRLLLGSFPAAFPAALAYDRAAYKFCPDAILNFPGRDYSKDQFILKYGHNDKLSFVQQLQNWAQSAEMSGQWPEPPMRPTETGLSADPAKPPLQSKSLMPTASVGRRRQKCSRLHDELYVYSSDADFFGDESQEISSSSDPKSSGLNDKEWSLANQSPDTSRQYKRLSKWNAASKKDDSRAQWAPLHGLIASSHTGLTRSRAPPPMMEATAEPATQSTSTSWQQAHDLDSGPDIYLPQTVSNSTRTPSGGLNCATGRDLYTWQEKMCQSNPSPTRAQKQTNPGSLLSLVLHQQQKSHPPAPSTQVHRGVNSKTAMDPASLPSIQGRLHSSYGKGSGCQSPSKAPVRKAGLRYIHQNVLDAAGAPRSANELPHNDASEPGCSWLEEKRSRCRQHQRKSLNRAVKPPIVPSSPRSPPVTYNGAPLLGFQSLMPFDIISKQLPFLPGSNLIQSWWPTSPLRSTTPVQDRKCAEAITREEQDMSKQIPASDYSSPPLLTWSTQVWEDCTCSNSHIQCKHFPTGASLLKKGPPFCSPDGQTSLQPTRPSECSVVPSHAACCSPLLVPPANSNPEPELT